MSEVHNGAAPAAPASPAASNGSAAPQPAPPSEREVAGVLAGLLGDDDGEDTPDRGVDGDTGSAEAGDEPADDDVAPDESTASDDDEAEADEPARAPGIEPPGGWTKEDRAQWAKLPASVQEIIRRRETEILGGQTRAQQERAEIERLALARLDQANQDRAQYVQNLSVFKEILLPGASQLDQVDWQRLVTENPAEYIRLTAQRDAMRHQLGAIQGEVERIQQVQQYEAQQRQAQAAQTGYQRLIEYRPEFADPQRAKEVGTKLGQFLRGFGFADNEIRDVSDARALHLALTAMEAAERTDALQSANTKRSIPTAPKVQRAGTSAPVSAEGGSRRMSQLANRFGETRTVEDAARIVAEWMR